MRGGRLAVSVLRVTSGNFLEMYDFFVFGYYAVAISHAFFPARDAFVSLTAALATFWAAFLMRPLGAIVLGSVIDRRGRRYGLVLTLGLMSAGTITLAATPGYGSIGVAAPVLVVTGRLLQGFSAGAELGGVSVFLAELAPPGRSGFFVAWQSASQQAAVMLAAGLGFALQFLLPAQSLAAWGWRIPLGAGCLILPLLLWLRRGMEETLPSAGAPPSMSGLVSALRSGWATVLAGTGMVTATTVAFYLLTAYTPTFGRTALHLSAGGVLGIAVLVGTANLIWLPVFGALSDRVGRLRVLIPAVTGMLLLAWPLMAWITAAPSLRRLLAAELVLSLCYGAYNGAMVAYLVEMVPRKARGTGFSLAYSLGVAVFGGGTPLVCSTLIHLTGDPSMPGLWLTAAAAIGLGSVLVSTRLRRAD